MRSSFTICERLSYANEIIFENINWKWREKSRTLYSRQTQKNNALKTEFYIINGLSSM